MLDNDGISEARKKRVFPATSSVRLPTTLSGSWLIVVRMLRYLALFGAGAILIGGIVASNARMEAPAWGPFGFKADTDRDLIYVESSFSEQSREIRRFDRIIAIDGEPMSEHADDLWDLRTVLANHPGPVVALRTRSTDGAVREHSLTRQPEILNESFQRAGVSLQFAGWVELVAGTVPVVLLVLAAFFLGWRKPTDPLAILLSLSLLMIAATNFVSNVAWEWIGIGILNEAIGNLGWWSFIVVLLVFPTGEFKPSWTIWYAAFALALMAVDVALPLSNNLSLILLLSILAVSLVPLARRYRVSPRSVRQQLHWAFLGFVVGTLILLTTMAAEAGVAAMAGGDVRFVIWTNLILYPLFSVGICAYALGLIVALLRYRLFDTEALLTRSATYSILGLLIAAGFAVAGSAFEALLGTALGRQSALLAGIMGAAVTTAIFVPLRDGLKRRIEGRFRSPLVDLRDRLPADLNDLRQLISIGDLADEVLRRIRRGIAPKHAALLIGDRAWTAGESAGVLAEWEKSAPPEFATFTAGGHFVGQVPLRILPEIAPLGWLLVGPRNDDDGLYDMDERHALERIAEPLARAVRVVQLRDARLEA